MASSKLRNIPILPPEAGRHVFRHLCILYATAAHKSTLGSPPVLHHQCCTSHVGANGLTKSSARELGGWRAGYPYASKVGTKPPRFGTGYRFQRDQEAASVQRPGNAPLPSVTRMAPWHQFRLSGAALARKIWGQDHPTGARRDAGRAGGGRRGERRCGRRWSPLASCSTSRRGPPGSRLCHGHHRVPSARLDALDGKH